MINYDKISIKVSESTFISLSELHQAIDDCMDDGIFMPAHICQEMGWVYSITRNSLSYKGQHTMSKYILGERLYRLHMMAVEGILSLTEASQLVGMRPCEVTRITRIHTGKSFMEQRREFQQRNANHSPVTHRRWHHHSSCR